MRKETDRARHPHRLEMESEGLVRTRKESSERGVLTSWRQQRVGIVRTQKESVRVRHTHFLETTEGSARQGTERS